MSLGQRPRSPAHVFLARKHPKSCLDERINRKGEPPNADEPVRTARLSQPSAHHCGESPDREWASSQKLWNAAGNLKICKSRSSHAHADAQHSQRLRKRRKSTKHAGRFQKKASKKGEG